ncbi:MAG: GIY-YIG nuclease family protein [Candidatus Jacksonbacteria bacterium]
MKKTITAVFPNSPGVYLMKNAYGQIIYIGKASSLKKRVSSYFHKTHNIKTAALVSEIAQIDYKTTDSILEATILEARLIKKYQAKYNIEHKDDKSFLYIVVTKEKFPRILIKRETELKIKNLKLNKNLKLKHASSAVRRGGGIKNYFGPFTSYNVVRSILKSVRRIFPWSNCQPKNKPCFYYLLKQCPGICTGEISSQEYQKTIRNIILFFQGKKKQIIKNFKKEMKKLSAQQKFEQAAKLRNQLYHLKHIQDAGLIMRNDSLTSTIGRIEGFDISNISGKFSAGSMAVFKKGLPLKNQYRRFKIKTVKNQNDVKMLQEIIKRRFRHQEWPKPDLILVDGGKAQVSAIIKILKLLNLTVSIVGIAKGPTRKKTDLIFGPINNKIKQNINQNKNLLIQIRDEAHRFALSYHRKLRRQLTIIKK